VKDTGRSTCADDVTSCSAAAGAGLLLLKGGLHMHKNKCEKLAPYGVDGQLLSTPPPPGEWHCNSRFFPLDLGFLV